MGLEGRDFFLIGNLAFVPEPGVTLLLAAGAVLNAALRDLRRRGRPR